MAKQLKIFGDDFFEEKEKEKPIEKAPLNASNSKKMKIVSSNSTSKSNDIISKKIDKIEKLKKQIEQEQQKIALIKKIYEQQATTYVDELDKIKVDYLVKLFERFKENGFLVWQKNLIEQIISDELFILISKGYYSEKLESLQKEFVKLTAKTNLDDLDKDEMKDLFKEFANLEDIDLEDDDFDFENIDDFQEKIKEQFFEQQHKEESKAHFEKQKQKTLTTDKSFQKLYKSLVKKVHPDLSTSSQDNAQREIWMKELSNAWEARNYYKLLLLQREISANNEEETILDDIQIKSLVKQLNSEIRELENSKYWMHSPMSEDSFYYTNFNAKSETGIKKKVNSYIQTLNEEKEELIHKRDIHLKTKASTKRFLVSINNEFNDEFNDVFSEKDIFDVLFDDF